MCPDKNACTTPTWTVQHLLAGVRFQPPLGAPDGCYTSLRQSLYAEEDVKRGCAMLAATLEDAQQYHGVREIVFDTGAAEPKG